MKKIKLFIALTFISTWGIAFWLMANGGYLNPSATLIITGCMFMPAIAAIITTFLTREKFKDVWIKPNFKGSVKYYIIGWLLPILLIVFGATLYYLIFPSHFDINMSFMINTTKEQLLALGQTIPSDSQLKSMLILQLFSAIFIAPVINFIPCLGEELGWRGYLLPNLLEEYTPVKTTIVSGIIWGIWHAPMIAMGHNYGLSYASAPWGGIIAMTIFCIFVGSLFSYITIKSKSCIPATLAHGLINGFASIGIMFIAIPNPNPFIGPTPVGIIGGLGFIIAGAICFKLMSKISLSDKSAN